MILEPERRVPSPILWRQKCEYCKPSLISQNLEVLLLTSVDGYYLPWKKVHVVTLVAVADMTIACNENYSNLITINAYNCLSN